MLSIGDGCNLVSSSFSRSPLLTLQPLEGLPDTLNLQLSHFPAQKSSMAPIAHCNTYKLPRLAVKAPQEGDPAHIPSLVSHCSPPGPLCSSQTAVLRALAAPSILTCKPFSYSASLRTTFSLSCLPEYYSSSKSLVTYRLLQVSCPSDQLPVSKLPQHADGTHLNFFTLYFCKAASQSGKSLGFGAKGGMCSSL